ncbi:MAG: Tn3 family transposase [gamma proteobacterium symbiont of Bathyaustriella thionipta]|nr:Tn3 family transposase [gamma proteobacterium symbiont of Bathyaustriella thionipta]MCU7950519.1 Tn3 family transposase [gamma proteobacterium symbiont of Bathyaustriella thionipta]MCU7952359.1 Tn3 family transposase [gamma proteobacterium symbiont of Bathyaustriella thionipta]MCU7957128.1 Tn3 family transposase [gamma proteobacterium symbiont of Bathyaustriella thionipta]MCU7967311.1 Tn3 family transposase [gamma proteobacterium symbiont of Bathyaustriella thionipta]
MKRNWSEQELSQYWTLSSSEQVLLDNKTDEVCLKLALFLKFFQIEARFPTHRNEIPTISLDHIKEQLDISTESTIQVDWNSRTSQRIKQQIRQHTGFRYHTQEDKDNFVLWLKTDILFKDHEFKYLEDVASSWFKERNIEIPGLSRLNRLIQSAVQNYETSFFNKITHSLSEKTKKALSELLTENNPDSKPGFNRLKSDPGRISLDSVLTEIEKLRCIKMLDLPNNTFKNIPSKIIKKYKIRVTAESSWDVSRHQEPVRYALLSMFCHQRTHEITDGLIDLLIQITHRISVRAEKKVVKELLQDLRKVNSKTTLLFKLAEAAIEQPEGIIKEVLYPVIGEQTLTDLVKEYKSTGPAYQKQIHTIIRASYSHHYRRMLPKILDELEFHSNNSIHQPVITAIDLLKNNRDNKQRYFAIDAEIPIDGVVKKKWKEIILEKDKKGDERINRINYEISVLQILREKLRCKEIWVTGADRYRDPDDDLPRDFDEKRESYYQDLGQTTNVEQFISELQKSMHQALRQLNKNMPQNSKVKILERGKKSICLTPLDAQPEATNIARLKGDILGRWPTTSLLDVLKEADLRIGFTDLFQNLTTREVLSREVIQKRLLLCLFGMGTNTGLKRISLSRHGISYKELLHIRKRYIHKSTVRDAIAQVVNAIFKIRRPDIWGEGTTACASDSKKFGSWDQNLMTEWHIRYGGRGVMIYWHVEKKSTCIYSQLKRCSSSEVASMIEGVLKHCTDMTIERQYVDSHGQSEVAFAFSHLLGFNLLPRLKAIATQKLYRPGSSFAEDYPNLEPALTRSINWEPIRQQYDEMIKYTTALKQGTAEPEAILRRFTRNNVQHPTYKALAELGKVIKTIFLCNYLDSEPLRREIHEGLNVVENWNSANSFIFYGKGGEVATNRLEDQELSVLCLHLLQISMVYVNTLMIQQILSEPRWDSLMTIEDYRALSPLIYSHINPYGEFELDMHQRLTL